MNKAKYICSQCSIEFLAYPCTRTGKKTFCSKACCKLGNNFCAGEKHQNWKGDNVSYWGLHKWRQRNLTKTGTCQHCNHSGLSRWSIHWANISHTYKRDNSDWIELCQSCHRLYDNGKLVLRQLV